MDRLYEASLGLLSSGAPEGQQEAAALALRRDPDQYALQLAEAVTGVPVVQEGYGQAYDLLLKVAPPAALSPEGVKKAHGQVRVRCEGGPSGS